MANKKPRGIDIFSSRTELVELMDAATGDPAEPPVVETVHTKKKPGVTPAVVPARAESEAPKEQATEVVTSVEDEVSMPASTPKVVPAKKSIRRIPEEGEAAIPQSNVEFRYRIPPELKVEWSTFKAEMSGALGGLSLDDSNLGRPLLEVMLVDYKEQILAQAEEYKGQLRRPSNADRVGMAELEAVIGDIFRKALRQRRRRQ